MLAIETRNNVNQATEFRGTVNDTDTTGTVSPVPVSYRFVLTVCNPTPTQDR